MKTLAKASIIFLFILCSCSVNPVLNQDTNNEKISSYKNKDFSIKGTTQFDNNFKIKSEDIATRATVSLIYPSDYSDINLRNATIATGLTDLQGNFIINNDQNFSPQVNQVMVLEASKRVGGAGNTKLSLRTNIRWNGNIWESISTPGIFVNKKTTSLSILSALDPTTLTPSETINKLVYSNNVANVIYTDKLTPSRFNAVYKAVDKLIFELKDPVENIANISLKYDGINDPSALDAVYITQTKANMHTFQTIVETYAVEYQGIYASNIENLKQDAINKNYWLEITNPYKYVQDFIPPVMNLSDYNQALLNNSYNGYYVVKSSLKGILIYEPINNSGFITSYYIYGTDQNGDFIKDNNNSVLKLSNN